MLREPSSVSASSIAVVQDNDYGTWRAFENRFWPAKYLVDKDGYIRYTHFGEGAYDETEIKIRELLAEAGSDLRTTQPDTSPLTGFRRRRQDREFSHQRHEGAVRRVRP